MPKIERRDHLPGPFMIQPQLGVTSFVRAPLSHRNRTFKITLVIVRMSGWAYIVTWEVQ